MMKRSFQIAATACAVALASVYAPVTLASPTHDGWMAAERLYDWDSAYEQPTYGGPRRHSDSRYGPGQDQNVAGWAIGTFRGQNSGNGIEETVTIRPDGSAELHTRDQPPKYGTFAGETLTFDKRMSRVQPARGGIVIDGAYYSR